MGLNEKQQLWVLIGVFALVLVGEGVYGYFSFQKRGELVSALDKLEAEERATQEKLSRVQGLRDEAREMAAIIEEYVTILPTDEEARNDSFLVDIDNFAKDAGLEVLEGKADIPEAQRVNRNSRNKKAKEEKKNFTQLRYRFKLRGTFLNFLKFTNRVENHSRFLRIDDIEVRPVNADEKDQGLEELVLAEEPIKDIEILISTYTYSKDGEGK